MRFARDAAVVLLVVLALPVVTTVVTGGDDGAACGLAAKRRVRHANATARLTTKPPLCQECAKTGKHSPTIRGTEWTRTSR
ncbi:MAG TPA: hypothetical protein VN888_01235 [Mycobacterium sp.]|nr:hypothetical protein [Mycobacterium sp.]